MADEFDFPAVFTKNLPNGDVITAQDDTVIQVPFRPSSQSKATLAPKRKAAAKVTAPKRAVKKTAAVRNPNISRTPGFGTGIESPELTASRDQVQATKDQTQTLKDIADDEKRGQLYLAAASFGLDVMNANSAYGAVQSASQLNILESRRQGSDAIERGRQRSLDARVEGQLAGGDAALALAAQGQDVQGADAQKVIGSLEDIGIYNGLQEETNSIRESLGHDLDIVALEHQIDQAEIQRDSTILSSALNFGTTAAFTI